VQINNKINFYLILTKIYLYFFSIGRGYGSPGRGGFSGDNGFGGGIGPAGGVGGRGTLTCFKCGMTGHLVFY